MIRLDIKTTEMTRETAVELSKSYGDEILKDECVVSVSGEVFEEGPWTEYRVMCRDGVRAGGGPWEWDVGMGSKPGAEKTLEAARRVSPNGEFWIEKRWVTPWAKEEES